MEYDLGIIGAGPGGYVSAIAAAKKNLKVLLVEKNKVGGACLHSGCIPTKIFLEFSEIYSSMEDFSITTIKNGDRRAYWARIQKEKRDSILKLEQGIQHLLKKNKVSLRYGTAQIEDNSHLKIVDSSGIPAVYSCKNIIIATGSIPIDPCQFFNKKLTKVITSDELLSLKEAPLSISIIGGGVIGCEAAQYLSNLGVQVSLIETQKNLLPNMDNSIKDAMKSILKKSGVQIYLETRVEEVNEDSSGISLRLSNGSLIVSELALLCVGRIPVKPDTMNNITISENEKGEIEVDTNFSVREQNQLWAIGDVNNTSWKLAHAASASGETVINTILGLSQKENKVIPTCVYTSPQAASVGISENQAKDLGIDIKTGYFPFSANAKALISGNTIGGVKIITEKKSEIVIGVHIVGPNASEIISEGCLAIEQGMTVSEIGEIVHAHPTCSEAFLEAALIINGSAIHI